MLNCFDEFWWQLGRSRPSRISCNIQSTFYVTAPTWCLLGNSFLDLLVNVVVKLIDVD